VLGRIGPPLVKRLRGLVVGPVLVLVGAGRIDDARDMSRSGNDKLGLSAEQRARVEDRFTRRDMVLAARLKVDRDLHLAKIEGLAAELEAPAGQKIVAVEIGQVRKVQRARHPRLVRVPKQQVERERVAAQQVIVDHVAPHQIVRTQHVEGLRHRAGGQHAAGGGHLRLERIELRVVDKYRQVARVREIHLCRKESCGGDAPVLDLRHIGQAGAQHCSANAIADGIDLFRAAGFFDRVERGEHARLEVIVKVEFRQPRIGIDPRNDKYGQALRNRPSDERLLLRQVEDVELVDPRRKDQQRALVNGLGGRGVLQKFEELVAVNDLPGCECEVAPDFERGEVCLTDRQLSLAALQILKNIRQAAHEIFAVLGQGRAQYFGVGQQEIGRRDRVGKLLGIKIEFRARLLVEAVDVGDRALQPARCQQIALLDEVEDFVLFPVGVAEALVARCGLDHGLDLFAQDAARGLMPQRGIVAPQIELRLDQPLGIGQDPRQQLGQRTGEIERIELRGLVILGLTRQKFAQQFLRLTRNMDHIGGEHRWIGRGGQKSRFLGRLGLAARFSVLVVHLFGSPA